jgi:hypothetical protein
MMKLLVEAEEKNGELPNPNLEEIKEDHSASEESGVRKFISHPDIN